MKNTSSFLLRSVPGVLVGMAKAGRLLLGRHRRRRLW